MDGLETPVARYKVSREILKGEMPLVPEEDFEEIWKIQGQHILERGFIHVFTSYPKNPFFDVYKCIIPKDTIYYADDTHATPIAYAAKQIVFLEKVYKVKH